jgi:two-component system KDP operon response regulator KdpE
VQSRVLVLDHDADRRGIIEDIVARAGGDTVLAESGAAAIEALASSRPHGLLVAGLPDGSLRGFVAWARPRYPDVAIVAIADDAESQTDLYNAGADIVTTAPLDADLIGAKLGAALRRTTRPHLRAAA